MFSFAKYPICVTHPYPTYGLLSWAQLVVAEGGTTSFGRCRLDLLELAVASREA